MDEDIQNWTRQELIAEVVRSRTGIRRVLEFPNKSSRGFSTRSIVLKTQEAGRPEALALA